jgi:hypothetical protein
LFYYCVEGRHCYGLFWKRERREDVTIRAIVKNHLRRVKGITKKNSILFVVLSLDELGNGSKLDIGRALIDSSDPRITVVLLYRKLLFYKMG